VCGAKSNRLIGKEFIYRRLVRTQRLAPSPRGAALGYYTDDGELVYAGRVGTGMPVKVLADLRRCLDPIARHTSPLSVRPPRSTRFGSPLILSRVHWVEPQLVAEITYLTWTADNLLRHTVFVGLREDKPAMDVRREVTRAT
jgi:ATP-dependent DNA ligase